MGRTDPYVFERYYITLNAILEMAKKENNFKNVALLGQTGHNAFTNHILSENFDFYDFKLNDWNINNSDWKIDKKYDLIVCTRCPYFCKDPEAFFNQCYNLLNDSGVLIADWALGDQWRYENFKIGWVKNDEHESFYEEDNYLWSLIWNNSFVDHAAVKLFLERVKKFGYDDIQKAISEEVPVIYDVAKEASKFSCIFDIQTYWEDLPQLYITFAGIKNK